MDKKIVKHWCSALCIVALMLVLGACNDPVIKIGKTIEREDLLNLSHMDTTTLILNTVAESNLQASGISTAVLGSMNDLYTGFTYASFYAQCLLSQNGYTFHVQDSMAAIDSAVLSLPYINDSARYGRCTSPIDVIVYEQSQDMYATNTYYNNDAFAVYPTPVGRLNNYTPDLKDSVHIDTFVLAPQIRVRLNNSFAQKLLATDSVSLSSSANFVNYLKGLYVTTNPSKIGSGIVYLNLHNAKITLYYHTANTPKLTYDFLINAYSAGVNHFDHNNRGNDIQRSLSTTTPDKQVYIQSGVGTKIKMQLPYLSNLIPPKNAAGKRDSSVAVVKAELILPYSNYFTNDSFVPPARVILLRLDDTLASQTLNGFNNSGVGLLSTRLDANGNSYNCYVFNLTEFVQRILDGYYNNNGFYIQYSYTVRADRVSIFNDPAADATKSKLKITYTKIK